MMAGPFSCLSLSGPGPGGSVGIVPQYGEQCSPNGVPTAEH